MSDNGWSEVHILIPLELKAHVVVVDHRAVRSVQ